MVPVRNRKLLLLTGTITGSFYVSLILINFHFTYKHSILTMNTVTLDANNETRISICMMVPVTSRNIPYNRSLGIGLLNQPLVRAFLPSIFSTAESKYNYDLYIGYDYGDVWYDNVSNWQQLLIFIEHLRRNNSQSNNLHIRVKPLILYATEQRLTAMYNTIAAAGYRDRCDYFYPANDDLQIRSYGWTTAAIQSLNSCHVAKDFGAVTFKDITLCRYPTFNLVHRTHLDLHEGVYYPVPSHGAHQDLWIFGLYELWQCSFYLSEHQVANHVGIGLNTRYKSYKVYHICIINHLLTHLK
ncbi:unnamed protein product [Adineta ricciae]|uniref:Uncharacterized protein n=1 Tax=Adineta ricciae TaxID=249248 RepID=A0A815RXE5_ADIRI|nr:unnamed protein product [Adineta ricciae]